MRRTLETICNKLMLLLLLIFCIPLISVAVAYFLPRSYDTTASLWALRRYESIGATGPESNIYVTPAETQATAFTELLQTREVALTIAKSVNNLAGTLSLSKSVLGNSALLDDALAGEISKHVVVTAKGYNLFVVSYSNRDPVVAQQVVEAAIKSYSASSSDLVIVEGQQLLQSYQEQLNKAQQDLDADTLAETQYLAAHPDLSQNVLRTNPAVAALADPHYGALHTQTTQDQATVNSIRANIDNLQQQITQTGKGANSMFKIIDQPIAASQPASRQKTLLTAGGVGAAIALLGCAICIIMLVRRDRAVYTMRDLQKITNLPVVMQLPHFSKMAIPSLVD